MALLHGVEIVELSGGVRPISTASASVIGLVGTAADADNDKFPVDTPVLLAGSRTDAAALGTAGTLPAAVDAIFDQIGALVVVIRAADDAGVAANVLKLKEAESILGVVPRILIAPGHSHPTGDLTVNDVAANLIAAAESLRGIAILDGPGTTYADALTYKGNVTDSPRAYLVDPWVTVGGADEAASGRVAGVIAKSDNERGFWWSPSNRPVSGIQKTSRGIAFTLGDQNSEANLLNDNRIATIIRKDGYRLWGNRSVTSDAKWSFISVRRTADIINDSLQRAHLWAVDRNITKTYLTDVLAGVNGFLRSLQARGAIINGKAWADPDLNTATDIADGKVTFDFDFTPPYPAEHITFRSELTNEYLTEVLP